MSAATTNPDAIDLDLDSDVDDNASTPQPVAKPSQIASKPHIVDFDVDASDAIEDDSSMMEAMGFAAFGAKPKPKNSNEQSKKRKFQASPTFGSKANATPLGVRRPGGHAIPARPPLYMVGRERDSSIQSLPQNPTGLNIDLDDDEDDVKDDAESKPSYTETAPPRSGMIGNADAGALRRGVRNQAGDIAYFLPSFIEDPWRGMVAKRWSDTPT